MTASKPIFGLLISLVAALPLIGRGFYILATGTYTLAPKYSPPVTYTGIEAINAGIGFVFLGLFLISAAFTQWTRFRQIALISSVACLLVVIAAFILHFTNP